MAESDELRITVSLVDNASAGLASMRRELQGVGQDAGKQLSPLKSAFEGVSKSIKDVTGGHTAAQFEAFKRSQGDMARVIKETTDVTLGGEKALLGFVGKFGLAGAAVASFGTLAGAAVASAKAWADSITSVAEKSKLLASHPADYEVLLQQYKQAGLNAEDLDQSLASLNKQAAQFADPESPMFRRLKELTADPRFFDSFRKFTDAFDAAEGPAAKMRVDLEAVKSSGESAAEDARKHGENLDTINRRRIEAENLMVSILEQSQKIRLLLDRPPLQGATDAQKARRDEMTRSAEALHQQFLTLEQDVSRLFNFWQVGAGGEKGWLTTALEGTDQRVRDLEDDLIALWGTAAQKAELAEKRTKQAKDEGRPPPEIPSQTRAAVDLLVGPTKPQKPSVFDWTDPGTALPGGLNALIDPLARRIHDQLFGGGRWQPPQDAPRRPPSLLWTPQTTEPAAPAPPPAPAPAYPELGIPALPGAVPTPPIRPLRFSGGDEDDVRGRLSTNIEDRRDPRAIQRDTAMWMTGDRDHERVVDQNTEQLRTLNDQLARMTERQPEEDGERPTFRAPSAELPLPPLPPMRQPPGPRLAAIEPPTTPAKVDTSDFRQLRPSRLIEDVSGRTPDARSLSPAGEDEMRYALRRHIGQPQFERALAAETEQRDRFRDRDDVGAGSVLRRDDRSELDRRMLDTAKPVQVQVEGSGTLTADIRAPAGTRVGLEARGLFKKTQLNRQTQMQLASTGPPNPAYSPTLEDFPL